MFPSRWIEREGRQGEAVVGMHTVDRIEYLAVSSTSSTLLDLRVIELQQIIEPLE